MDATSLIARVLDAAAPRPLRLAAARGALPLGRPEMVLALVRLGGDADPEIASESRRTLSGMGKEILLPLLSDEATDPSVLGHFARDAGASPDLLHALVANPATPADALLDLAGREDETLLDRLVTNETRLASVPDLVERIKANPALSRDTRRRITELEEHVLGHPGMEPIVAPMAPADAEQGMDIPEAAVEMPPVPEGEETPGPVLQIPLTPEELAAEEALRRTPLFQRIVRMTVAEKIQAAIKGNAEERSILIRDPSRIVAANVLKSPKLNEQEIESYANLRNVSEEVLRIIGNHRDWTKAYGVAHALARNPRSPTGVSLTMLNRLVIRDLKNLAQDKNIPDVIRRSAKRLYELRTQPQTQSKKGK